MHCCSSWEEASAEDIIRVNKGQNSIFKCKHLLCHTTKLTLSYKRTYRLRQVAVMNMRRRRVRMPVMGVDAPLRWRWCDASGRKARARLQSNSHSGATVLEESPLNKQLKADNEGASRQQGLSLTDCLTEPDRPSKWLMVASVSRVRLKHQWMWIGVCALYSTELILSVDSELAECALGVINETSGEKKNLISVMSVKLLFSKRSVLGFPQIITDLFYGCAEYDLAFFCMPWCDMMFPE